MVEGVEGGAGEEVHVGGFFPPSDSQSCLGGAGGQSKCEGDERGVDWEEVNNYNIYSRRKKIWPVCIFLAIMTQE